MRVFETIRRSLLPTLAAGTMLVSVPLSAQTINFSDLGYNSPVNANYALGSQTNWNSHFCNWGGHAIANPYQTLTWTGFGAVDLQDYLYSDGQQSAGRCFVNGRSGAYNISPQQQYTGYQQQLSQVASTTGTNVLAVSGRSTAGFSREGSFVMESMLLGAGWGNVSNLRVSGLLGGVQQWVSDFSFLGIGGATSMLFGPNMNINEILFSATYVADQGAIFDPYNTMGEQGVGGYGLQNPTRYATFFVDNINLRAPTTVPEPSTYALMATGLAALAFAARRRRKS